MSRSVLNVVVWLGLFTVGQASQSPNVIIFLVDDMGWTDLGCYGSDLYQTPHIDRLATSGMRFTDAYSACTVCSPTRAALMTGQYPARLHLTDWINGMWEGLSPAQRKKYRLRPPEWIQQLEHRHTTLAEALGQAGYRTAHLGKWHLTPRSNDAGVVSRFFPKRHGFEVNVAGNQWGAPGSYYWPYRRARQKNKTVARVTHFPPPESTRGKYLTDMLADQAVGLIERWKGERFFLHLAHYAVHTPIQGRPELVKKYQARVTPAHRHRNAEYAAMVESVDRSVGAVVSALDRLELTDNTVIVFTSDNGGLIHARNGPTDNRPLRAGKGAAYEGGVRVPTIVSWPGRVPRNTTCREPVITCDLYPTVLEMTGVPGDVEHNSRVDGVSLLPVLTRDRASLGRSDLFWHYPHYHRGGATPYSAIRSGPWRLVEFYEDRRVELFHLGRDPGERKNLAKTHPRKAGELRDLLHQWRRRVSAQPPRANPEFQAPSG